MTMVAAPFYGEFGWEVALWAPWLRFMKHNHYRQAELTVLCKQGHEALYADFSSDVVGVKPPEGITKVDCQNVWVNGAQLKDWPAEIYRLLRRKVLKPRVIHPHQMRVRWDPVPTSDRLEYRKLAEPDPQRGKIAFHVRMCKDKQPGRNWEITHAMEVAQQLRECGTLRQPMFVGSVDGAGAALLGDRRGVTIEEDIAALATCEIIVGPSSGPLHLANQCGVRAAWWSPNAKEVPRYGKTWNPFDVANVQVAASWKPTISEVVDAVRKACSSPT